jgi:hypothetical protein
MAPSKTSPPSWPLTLLLAALVAALLPSPARADSAPAFTPFIEQFASGRIDWDSGQIYGVGRAYLDANGNSAIKARKAADLLASANIVRLATGIRLDDKQTLAALGRQHATLRLEAMLRDEAITNILVDDGKRPYFEATRMAAIKGISGLSAKLLTALQEYDMEWRLQPSSELPAEPDTDDEPWLVLDARSLPPEAALQPALFPKIISRDGEVIYQLRQVAADALARQGMARYVLAEQENLGQQSKGAGSLAATFLAALDRLLGPAEAVADGPRQKRRRYIVTEVSQAVGLTQTTLMISAQDAKRVKEENRSSAILKKCRVIVVMSSPTGGIEGRLPGFLAQAHP